MAGKLLDIWYDYGLLALPCRSADSLPERDGIAGNRPLERSEMHLAVISYRVESGPPETECGGDGCGGVCHDCDLCGSC